MGEIVDSAVTVSRVLGSGFLEKVYQQALAVELRSR
ncbi:MAG: GxxExxY protein, partial [Muribaculaceae bacterium]|nr:GxxExxY protein [Muribaculaceae bacterium]